jgi:hypothetical protein
MFAVATSTTPSRLKSAATIANGARGTV